MSFKEKMKKNLTIIVAMYDTRYYSYEPRLLIMPIKADYLYGYNKKSIPPGTLGC